VAADTRRPHGISLLIGVLLAAATAAFVWGAFAERSGHHDVHSASTAATSVTTSSSDPTAAGGETAQEKASESGAAPTVTAAPDNGETPAQHKAESAATPSGPVAETTEFHPLGVSLESTPLVMAAGLVSLLLACAVALQPRRGVFSVVAVVAAAFVVLEIVEVSHQVSQDRPGLVALAAIAGLLHAAVAVLTAGQLAVPRRLAVA
jgi:hypothetical protein